MAPDGAPEDRPEPSGVDPAGEQSEQRHPPERYGPLAVARHRKDDGRALILYTLEDARA
jgi:hypothetical protein